jgi:hypothetical protein
MTRSAERRWPRPSWPRWRRPRPAGRCGTPASGPCPSTTTGAPRPRPGCGGPRSGRILPPARSTRSSSSSCCAAPGSGRSWASCRTRPPARISWQTSRGASSWTCTTAASRTSCRRACAPRCCTGPSTSTPTTSPCGGSTWTSGPAPGRWRITAGPHGCWAPGRRPGRLPGRARGPSALCLLPLERLGAGPAAGDLAALFRHRLRLTREVLNLTSEAWADESLNQ